MRSIVSALILLILVGPAMAQSRTDAPLCFSDELVVLAFTSKACSRCQQDKDELERLRSEGYVVEEIDVQQSPEIAKKYEITELPTYVVEHNGEEVKRTHRVGFLFSFLIGFLIWLFF